MLGFGAKRSEPRKPPEQTEKPMVGYVRRTAPEKWRGHLISGKIPESPFNDIHSLEELEQRVAEVAGGHEYEAKLHEQGDTSNYLGVHKFRIASEPLFEGRPYKPAEESGEDSDGLPRDIRKIKADAAAQEALMELDEKKAARAAKLRALSGEENDDGEEGEYDGLDSLREEFNDKLGTAIDEIKNTLLKAREQEDADRRHHELMETIKAAIQGRGTGTSDVAAVMGAQMEAMKAIVSSGQESTKAVLQAIESNRKESSSQLANLMQSMTGRSDNIFQLLLTTMQNSASQQFDTLKQVMDAKTGQIQSGFEMMKEAMQTGMALGMGRESLDDGPKSLTDVFATFTEKVADLAGKYIDTQGAQKLTKEKLKDIMGRTASKAVSDYKIRRAALEPPVSGAAPPPTARTTGRAGGRQVPHPRQTAEGIDGIVNEAVDEAYTTQEPPTVTDAERSAMNQAIDQWNRAIDEVGDVDPQRFLQIAQTTLPMNVIGQFISAAGDPNAYFEVIKRYGDTDKVEEFGQRVARIAMGQQADIDSAVESAVESVVRSESSGKKAMASAGDEEAIKPEEPEKSEEPEQSQQPDQPEEPEGADSRVPMRKLMPGTRIEPESPGASESPQPSENKRGSSRAEPKVGPPTRVLPREKKPRSRKQH